MQFVDKLSYSEFEIKKSKFISYLFPYSKFQITLDDLKQKHPKARHYVYAYRYLNEFEQIVENQSDDGEPKGSSGRPTLNVMQGKEIINSAIITVRYFGGIKLGVGGLVRAYKDSANLVLDSSLLLEYMKMRAIELETTYSNLSRIDYIISNYQVKEINRDFLADRVKLFLNIKEQDWERFNFEVKPFLIEI